MNDWLRKEEICNKLGISARTLRRRVASGVILRKQGYSKGYSNKWAYYCLIDQGIIRQEQSIPIPLASSAKSKLTQEYNARIDGYLRDVARAATDIDFSHQQLHPNTDMSLCLMLSDTHIGQKTASYNDKVAQDIIINQIPNMLLNKPIPHSEIGEVVIMLTGDLVEGEDIYQTQSHHICLPVIEQVELATNSFMQLGAILSAELECPVRFETVPGNHGRISKTASELSNWDNIIYQNLAMAEAIARQYDPNFEIIVNKNYHPFTTFFVQGHKVLIYHHGTKHLGTPAMKIKHEGWYKTHQWDLMAHGHWHEWSIGSMFGRPVISNGSIVGYNDLAERMGVYDPPRQAWWLMSEGEVLLTTGYLEFEHGRI